MRVVERGPPRGRVLVAAQPLLPGQAILEEPLILLKPEEFNTPGIYRAFLASPPDVQRQILSLFSPVDGVYGRALRNDLAVLRLAQRSGRRVAAEYQEMMEVARSLDGRQQALFVKVNAAFNYNSVWIGPPSDDVGDHKLLDMGSGLFTIGSRASHSCQPNCSWLSDRRGHEVMRALVDVAEGEELTIAYRQFELEPVYQRRATLFNSWDFLCACPRCVAHGDDTRRFPCKKVTCSGYHLVHQPTAGDLARLTACSACGVQATPTYATRLLQQEAGMIKHLAEIHRDTARHDASIRDLDLRPLHPHHSLAVEAAHLQYMLYKQSKEWVKAAKALQAEIECRDAILRFPTITTALRYECRGDMLMAAIRVVGVGEKKRGQLLAQAGEAYRHAEQGLLITGGPSHPWTALATAKLAAAEQEQGGGGAERAGEAKPSRKPRVA